MNRKMIIYLNICFIYARDGNLTNIKCTFVDNYHGEFSKLDILVHKENFRNLFRPSFSMKTI